MFAVLHIADFALHAVLRIRRSAGDQPAALFSGTNTKSVVLAANPCARALGVELGMTAPQAVARCPALVMRSPNATAEAEARAALFAVALTLSPTIEDTAPGVCTADVKGVDPAQRAKLAALAVTQLEQLGLPATVGIARTPLLALYAARAATSHRSRSLNRSSFSPQNFERENVPENEERARTEAPPSFHLGDPVLPRARDRALTRDRSPSETETESTSGAGNFLHVTDEKTFLTPLPLAAADPSPELATVLQHWGVRTLGDLTALPRDEIIRRFGAEGLALWQRAMGGDPRPLHPVIPAAVFAAEMEFEHEIETLEPLLFILRRFLDRLTLELRASQHVAAEIHLTLKLEDDTHHARSFRLPEPTADAEILFRTLHTHLESLQTGASISALDLRLTPARPLVRQQGLFETGLRDPHGFNETLARVSALVGSDRVGTPQRENTHRPDAVKLIAPQGVIPPAVEPPLHPPLGLPLRRFRPPLPVQLSSLEGATYLWSDRLQGEISSRSQAYPQSGEWWQPDRAWQRTEWDIALADGGLYRLIRIGDAYFIEGEYD